KVQTMSQKYWNQKRDKPDFATNYEIHSHVESSVMRYPEAHGGSGYAASAVADLGFEPTMGATSSYAKPTRARKKTIEVGEGLSAAGVSATGFWLLELRLAGFQLGPRSARAVRRTRGRPAAPC
ncbi:MAG: hypothetical protein ACKPKO_41515, partial [Candidatus Fonsibacter sp.]